MEEFGCMKCLLGTPAANSRHVQIRHRCSWWVLFKLDIDVRGGSCSVISRVGGLGFLLRRQTRNASAQIQGPQTELHLISSVPSFHVGIGQVDVTFPDHTSNHFGGGEMDVNPCCCNLTCLLLLICISIIIYIYYLYLYFHANPW